MEIHFFPVSADELAERSRNLRNLLLRGARRAIQQNRGPKLVGNPERTRSCLWTWWKNEDQQASNATVGEKTKGRAFARYCEAFWLFPGYSPVLSIAPWAARSIGTDGRKLWTYGERARIAFNILKLRDALTFVPAMQGKTGYLTCPNCSHQLSKQDARIRKEKDYFLAVRHGGCIALGA